MDVDNYGCAQNEPEVKLRENEYDKVIKQETVDEDEYDEKKVRGLSIIVERLPEDNINQDDLVIQPKPLEIVKTFLDYAQNTTSWQDVIIHLADGYSEKFHGLVLGAQSGFFRDLMEDHEYSVDEPLQIYYEDNVSFADLSILREFIYYGTNSIQASNFNHVIELFHLNIKPLPLEKYELEFDDYEDEEVEMEMEDEKLELTKKKRKKKKEKVVGVSEKMREFAKRLEIGEDVINTCPYCKQIFSNRKKLFTHIKYMHRKAVEKVCEICGVSTKSISSHMVIHNDVNQFTCEYCGENFKFKNSLTIHLKNYGPNHNVVDNYFECEDCDQKFNSVNERMAHRKKNHVPEHQFQCEKCAKVFLKKDSLTYHLETVHKEKPNEKVPCPSCDKSFTSKRTLKTHYNMRHVVSDVPQICHICNKSFINYNQLQSHVRLHRAKNYLCKYCPAKFYDLYKLNRHEVSNHLKSNELRRTKCEFCHKGFNDNTAKRNHQRVNHKSEYIRLYGPIPDKK